MRLDKKKWLGEDGWEGLKSFASRMEMDLKSHKSCQAPFTPWHHVPPVWELRVGDYRVFYDVMPEEQTVCVRAVRFKPPHSQTEDIL